MARKSNEVIVVDSSIIIDAFKTPKYTKNEEILREYSSEVIFECLEHISGKYNKKLGYLPHRIEEELSKVLTKGGIKRLGGAFEIETGNEKIREIEEKANYYETHFGFDYGEASLLASAYFLDRNGKTLIGILSNDDKFINKYIKKEFTYFICNSVKFVKEILPQYICTHHTCLDRG